MKPLNRIVTIITLLVIASYTSFSQVNYQTLSGLEGEYQFTSSSSATYDITLDLSNYPVSEFTVRLTSFSSGGIAFWYSCPFSCYPDAYQLPVGNHVFPLTNGKAYIRVYGASTTATIFWTGCKNEVPEDGGGVVFQNNLTTNDLIVFDGKSKSLGVINSYTSDYTKAPVLIKSGSGSQLGVSPSKISANSSFGISAQSALYFTAATSMYFKSGNYSPLTLGSNGKVAVGTNSATACLDVYNATNPNLMVRSDATYGTLELGVQTSAGTFAPYAQIGDAVVRKTNGKHNIVFNIPNTLNDGSNYLSFGDNANGRTLSVLNNGKVLIGTTDQTVDAKLAVKGIIRADEIKVATLASNNVEVGGSLSANSIKVSANGQTADFVFDEGYELKTLAEVEQYIKEHKHLPNIPSAAQMEANGVDLAEMNKLLLQKVEELTLYIIEQNREMEIKVEEINQLENHIANQCLEIRIINEKLAKLFMLINEGVKY